MYTKRSTFCNICVLAVLILCVPALFGCNSESSSHPTVTDSAESSGEDTVDIDAEESQAEETADSAEPAGENPVDTTTEEAQPEKTQKEEHSSSGWVATWSFAPYYARKLEIVEEREDGLVLTFTASSTNTDGDEEWIFDYIRMGADLVYSVDYDTGYMYVDENAPVTFLLLNTQTGEFEESSSLMIDGVIDLYFSSDADDEITVFMKYPDIANVQKFICGVAFRYWKAGSYTATENLDETITFERIG